MMMEESEICRSYRNAVNRRMQIGILADLNMCSRKQILKVLILNGQDISALTPKKAKKKDEVEEILFATLDELDAEIGRLERQYKQVVRSFMSYGRKA